MALERVLGVLEAVAPFLAEPAGGEPFRARRACRRRLPDAGVKRFVAGVALDAEVHVLVAYERAVRVDAAARPGADRPPDEIRRLRRVDPRLAAVLVDFQAVRIHRLDEGVEPPIEHGAERPLVPHRVDGEGGVAAVVAPKLFHVALRVEGERLGRGIAVVREFGLDHDAEFVGGLEVFRQFAVRVEPREIEAGLAGLRQMRPVQVAVRRRDARDGVDVVVAEAAHEERTVVEEELPSPHFELPDAETLAAGVDDAPALDELDDAGVEVGMLRRPRPQGRQRQPQDRFLRVRRRRGLGRAALHGEPDPARGAAGPRDGHVRLGGAPVEVSAHPGVVDERRRGGLELHVAIQAAPAVHRAHQPLARRSQVGDLRHHGGVRAGDDEVGDLVFARGAVVLVQRHLPVVHPDVGAGLRAADFEPDALSGPVGGDFDGLPIPAAAQVHVADGLGAVVAAIVPARGHPRLSDALRLPAARDEDLARPRPLRAALEMLPDAVARPAGGGELPFAPQRKDAPGLVAQHGIHDGGMFLAAAPRVRLLDRRRGGKCQCRHCNPRMQDGCDARLCHGCPSLTIS